MHLELHIEAINNFNEKADKLLLLLAPVKNELPPQSFKGEIFIDHHFNEKDFTGPVKHSKVDSLGQEISKIFKYESKEIGLENDSYQAFNKHCELLQRHKSICDYVSIKTIKEVTFEWMESRYKGETSLSFTDFIFPRLESQIKEYEIWVPIYSLLIQSSFKLGRVLFQPITQSLIDNWQENSLKNKLSEEHGIDLIEYYKKERKDVQGLCAGVIKITAEPERVEQLAFEEIERTLNILRFYEFANFHPMVVSHCTVLGKENMQTIHYYRIENELIETSSTSSIEKGLPHWKLDNEMIKTMFSDGLAILDTILALKSKSEYQKALIDVLQIYSRNGLCHNYSD